MDDRQAVAVVDVVQTRLDAVVDVLLATRQVHKALFDNAAPAAITRNIGHGRLVDDGLPDAAAPEVHHRRLVIVPLIHREALNSLSLRSLLDLTCLSHLVLAGGHVSRSWSKVKNTNVRPERLLFWLPQVSTAHQ